MSYILDALKKSESERRAGVTPGLAPAASYVVMPQHRSRHRGAALLVAVGMLGTGLALGHWRPWQEDMAGGPMPKPGPIAAAFPVTSPALTVTPSVVATAAPPAAESPELSTLPSSVSANIPPVITVNTSTVVAKKRSRARSKDAPVVAAITRPAALPSGSAGKVAASSWPAPLSPTQIALAAPTMAVPAAAPVPPAARGVPAAVVAPVMPPVVATPAVVPAPVPRIVDYRELPAAVQGALPNIVFGGFAGGGETEGRIAFINNRLVREGEEVSPGLRLETVDQNGVVLGFQGHHFRTAQ